MTKEKEVPTHYGTVCMPSEMDKLKEVIGETQTKVALRKAMFFAINNYKEEEL